MAVESYIETAAIDATTSKYVVDATKNDAQAAEEASATFRRAIGSVNELNGGAVDESTINDLSWLVGATAKIVSLINREVEKIVEGGTEGDEAVDAVFSNELVIKAYETVVSRYIGAATKAVNSTCSVWIAEKLDAVDDVEAIEAVGGDALKIAPDVVTTFGEMQTFRFVNPQVVFMTKAPADKVAEDAKTALKPYFDYLRKEANTSATAAELYRKLDALVNSEAEKWFAKNDLSDSGNAGEREIDAIFKPIPETDRVTLDINRATQIVFPLTRDERLVANGDMQAFPVSTSKDSGDIMIGLSFANEDGLNLNVSFSGYDWLVSNVVNTLVDNQNSIDGTPLAITPNQLLRFLNATPNANPSDEQIKKVEESLDKMLRANVKINMESDKTAGGDGIKYIEGHLYDGMVKMKERYRGEDINHYYIPQTAKTWQISKSQHRMFTVPASALETPGKRTTVEQKEIQATLLKRLAPMHGSSAKSTSPVITWSYLYEMHNVDRSNFKKTASFRKKVLDQLELWRAREFIEDYYQIKTDKTRVRENERRPALYGVVIVTKENASVIASSVKAPTV